MTRPDAYVGINNDTQGGMTAIGKIIHDAWVFGLIKESETCEGWDFRSVDALLDKVNIEWDKYGCSVSQLPDDLFEKHQRIYNKAIKEAKKAGWSGEFETDDES